LLLVVHERLGTWGRQLRPRAVHWPVRVVETRSASELELALTGTACPIIVIDLADRLRARLEDLHRAGHVASNALTLVLDPADRPGVAALARELGATHVLSGPAPPPRVVDLLVRWLPLAKRRAGADGWSTVPAPDPEPWDGLLPDSLVPWLDSTSS
jgi:hypothetical protein